MKNNLSKCLFVGLLNFFFLNILSAQDHPDRAIPEPEAQMPTSEWCPSSRLREEALARDPNYRLQQEKYEESYRRSVSNGPTSPYSLRSSVVSTIPVVIHVFHSGQAVGSQQNPSDDMLKLWVQRASDRFRHVSGLTFPNPYSGIDCEIDLCLARRDPSGNPTNGINRYNMPSRATPPSAWDPAVLNPQLWDKTKYCNLIIITSAPPDFNFAGVYYGGSFYDFTIYTSTSMGSATSPNSGLMAHELGHYFTLGHTFDGSSCTNTKCLENGDKVCDTPPKAASGFSNPTTCAAPSNSCMSDADDIATYNPLRPVANGGIGDQTDALENYMDYTGSCWAAFSQGQKARMQANLLTRTALTGNSLACTPIPNACSAPVSLAATANNSNVLVSWVENATATSWEVKYGPSGFDPSSGGTAVVVNSNPALITGLNLSTNYDWYVRGICPNSAGGYSSFSVVNSFTTPSSSAYCSAPYTNPCGIQSHNLGDVPISIASFSVGRLSDQASILSNLNNGCLGSISDHTSIVGNISVGTTYYFIARYGVNGGNICYLGYLGVWIDYNNDKDFDDPNEAVYVSTTFVGCTINANFTVPSGITNGAKRMRVRRLSTSFSGITYCSTSAFGETEDYTVVVSGGLAIPLELVSFSAKAQFDKTIALDWTTASEQNVAYFDVERSFSGKNFEKIGQVKAVGNSNAEQHYNMIDAKPQASLIYYRLKMVDNDGSFKYSAIRTVVFNPEMTVSVYPNPTSKGKGLTFETNTAEAFDLKLIDLQGRVVLATQFNQSTVLNINHLAQGMYIYELKSKTNTQFGKVILE
jgi:GEVED domain/Secretion system C-terminal sorting domain/Pregnancy-associated plasma protein-A